MYYDDQARRFNFASGLLLGAVLGTGLALLAKPPKKVWNPKGIRGSAKSLKRSARSRLCSDPAPLERARTAARRVRR